MPGADSNLYLRRRGEALLLTVEHRAAPSTSGLALELRARGEALALHVVDRPPEPDPDRAPPARARLEDALAHAATPLTLRQLRALCRLRTATLCEALATLRAEGRVLKAADGYQLAPP